MTDKEQRSEDPVQKTMASSDSTDRLRPFDKPPAVAWKGLPLRFSSYEAHVRSRPMVVARQDGETGRGNPRFDALLED
jgi:hypothetical protein